jgi:hypothetical protein
MTLLSRVEALTGPDRDVDAELWADVAGIAVLYLDLQNSAPPLTSSVDAALAFAEKVLMNDIPTFCYAYDLNYAASAHAHMSYVATLHLAVGIPPVMSSVSAQSHTMPLAICIAVLRAKEGT